MNLQQRADEPGREGCAGDARDARDARASRSGASDETVLMWQKQTVSGGHGKQTCGCWQAGAGQAVPTTPGSPLPRRQRARPAEPRARGWKGSGCHCEQTSLQREPARPRFQRFQLLGSLLLRYLISTAERNNKLEPGFGRERLGPPCTFPLAEIA